MSKLHVSVADMMRMQTLREHCLGAKAIISVYPEKSWKLSTVKKIESVEETGSVTQRKAGSGRPESARSETNIALRS